MNAAVTSGDAFPDMYKRFWIYENVFENCGNGIIFRGKQGRIFRNVFLAVGLSNMLNEYDFITDGGLNRYYSKTRSAYSGQAASGTNTLLPATNGIVQVNQAIDTEIYENGFYGCAGAQLMPAGQPAATRSIMGGDSNTRVKFYRNLIDESASPAGIETPLWITNTNAGVTVGTEVEQNTFILPNGYAKSSVIRFPAQADNLVSKNKVRIIDGTGAEIDYTGTVYYAIAEAYYTVVDVATGSGFATGWQNQDTATYLGAGYYKDENKIVRFQGMVQRVSGTGAHMFQLNGGYRPPKDILQAVVGNNAVAIIKICANYWVDFVAGDPSACVDLSGIMYKVK
jgi:hypothetical protein